MDTSVMDDGSLVLTRHKLNADDYFRMAEAGILGKGDRVELIDGEIIDMAPIGQGHGSTVSRVYQALVLALHGRATVYSQSSLRLDRLNVPEPDFAVLKYRADFYGTGEPAGPDDVLLLIEVSDSSLRYDRSVKLPLYARSRIPETWIVDLKRHTLECYRLPEGDRYSVWSTHHPGETVALQAAPDLTLNVTDLIGA